MRDRSGGLVFVLVPVVGRCDVIKVSRQPQIRRNTIERKSEKGPVKLFVRVWPREPRLSDLVDLDITVESQPGVEVKPPAFGQAVGDFLVRDYTERPSSATEKNLRRFHYQLEPAHAGKHLIRSVSIEFLDKRPNSERRGEPALIETEPLEVNVTSELGAEAPSLANLEPMLPPQPVPQTTAIGWVVASGLAVLLAIVAFWALRRRKGRPIEPRRQTPEEIAQAALGDFSRKICQVAVSSRNSICGSLASSVSMLRTRRGSGHPNRQRRNSCATCGRGPRLRRSVPRGLRNFWRQPI